MIGSAIDDELGPVNCKDTQYILLFFTDGSEDETLRNQLNHELKDNI